MSFNCLIAFLLVCVSLSNAQYYRIYANYPLDDITMQPEFTQIVTNGGLDVSRECQCSGKGFPCPMPTQLNFGDKYPCLMVNGTSEPYPAVATPPVNVNSYFYAQFFAPTVNVTSVTFDYFIYSCTPTDVLTISIILNDTVVPWPNNTAGLNFTWSNKPNPSNVDIVFLENFTCPFSGSYNFQILGANIGPLLTANRRGGNPTFTMEFKANGTNSFRLVAPYGYNLTVSSGLLNSFGIYSYNRFGYLFSYNFGFYYTNSTIIITDQNTYDTYPIGYAEASVFELSFTDFSTMSNFTNTVKIVPPALAVPPDYPIMGSIYVLNEDETPANPSFYNEQEIINYFDFGGPDPYYTPYGICVAQTYLDIATFAGVRFCSQAWSAISARLQGPVDSRGISGPIIDFPVLRTEDGEVLALITAKLYPQYIIPSVGIFWPPDYPIESLTITTNDLHIYGTGSFFIWLFVYDITFSIDSMETVRLERSSNPTQVFMSVYPVNTSPDLNTITQSTYTFTDTPVSKIIEVINFDDDGYSGVLVTAPTIGTVVLDLAMLIWTYTPFPSLNSVNSLNGNSDMFSFYVADNSSTPCDKPLPAYTTTLVNPVLNCTNTTSCGHCKSGVKTVYVFVAPAYCQPVTSNITIKTFTGNTGTIDITIDNSIVSVYGIGCVINNVTIASPTQAGIVGVVSAVYPTFVFEYSLTNLTFQGNDTFYYNVTTNQNTWGVGLITIEVIYYSESQSMSMSPSISSSNSLSVSSSDSRSQSRSISSSRSLSPSISASHSQSVSPSISLSQSRSASQSTSASYSPTPSLSASDSQSETPSISISQSNSASRSISFSTSHSPSQSGSQSVSFSDSRSYSQSASLSQSDSSSQSDSTSMSASFSMSTSSSHSRSESRSESTRPNSDNDNKLNGGVLAGIVVGSTVFLILLALLVIVCASAKKSIKYAKL